MALLNKNLIALATILCCIALTMGFPHGSNDEEKIRDKREAPSYVVEQEKIGENLESQDSSFFGNEKEKHLERRGKRNADEQNNAEVPHHHHHYYEGRGVHEGHHSEEFNSNYKNSQRQ